MGFNLYELKLLLVEEVVPAHQVFRLLLDLLDDKFIRDLAFFDVEVSLRLAHEIVLHVLLVLILDLELRVVFARTHDFRGLNRVFKRDFLLLVLRPRGPLLFN